MSIVKTIDTITEWARENICKGILLKCPPENDRANDSEYDYTLIEPACFSVFVPSKDKVPPTVKSPMPSLCVQPATGKRDRGAPQGSLEVEFWFSTWSPGTYGKDLFYMNEDGSFRQGDEDSFVRDVDGWRDAWNWVDLALNQLESSPSLDGVVISPEIEFGPYAEDKGISNMYPFYFAYVRFTAQPTIDRDFLTDFL